MRSFQTFVKLSKKKKKIKPSHHSSGCYVEGVPLGFSLDLLLVLSPERRAAGGLGQQDLLPFETEHQNDLASQTVAFIKYFCSKSNSQLSHLHEGRDGIKPKTPRLWSA